MVSSRKQFGGNRRLAHHTRSRISAGKGIAGPSPTSDPGRSRTALFLVPGDRGDLRVDGPDIVVGRDQNLHAALAGGDRDQVEEPGGLVEVDGVILLAPQGG